jgi:hypothetical protein
MRDNLKIDRPQAGHGLRNTAARTDWSRPICREELREG